MSEFCEYPIVHFGSLKAPGSKLTIIATSDGLKALLFAIADAIGKDGHGLAELFCNDAEAYSLDILRQDCKESWAEIPLPYPNQPQGPGEPQDPNPINDEPHDWNWDDPSGAWR